MKTALKVVLGVLGFALGFVLLVLAWSFLAPPQVPASHPNPAKTYAQALERIEAAKSADPPEVLNAQVFLGQGSRTETAVVLFHGFTSKPKQMRLLAEELSARGYNVYVPRLPYHGYADPMTDALTKTTTADLTQSVDNAVDIGAGLGKHVVVAGLSGGGGLATWAVANRDEVSGAVIMAPLYEMAGPMRWITRPLGQIVPRLPTIWHWWSPEEQAKPHQPGDTYPRFPLGAFGDFLAVADAALRGKPQRTGQIPSIAFVANLGDPRLDNARAEQVLKAALGSRVADWRAVDIPASRGYAHDIISPDGENAANITEIYALLLPLFGASKDATAPAGASWSVVATSTP
jgi:hypothetical protein